MARPLDLVGEVTEPVTQPGWQCGRGVEQHPQPGEEVPRELRVRLKRRDELGVAGGHVEVDRRRDVAEVGDRLLEQAGAGRPASM